MPTKDRAHVVAVHVYYCDKNGQLQDEWVNLDEVNGIAWCDADDLPARAKKPTHASKLPKITPKPEPPTECPITLGTENGLCWWTGAAWVCGD